MPDVVPHKRAMRRQGRLRRFRADPVEVKHGLGQRAEITFSDGSAGQSVCLGCGDAPCMKLTEAQLNLGEALGSFPGDPSRSVCPVDAINWDDAQEKPHVDDAVCVGCGLCAAQCPYGAISLSKAGVAVVAGDDRDGVTVGGNGDASPHVIAPRTGTLGGSTGRFLRDLPKKVNGLRNAQASRLTRNLLIASGTATNLRRKGDTNVRMDGLSRFASRQIGVIELETGEAVMETPRALLEDIAILHNRIGVPLERIVPISIITSLPNARAEYYQVMDDIEKVLDIRCRTLTLGALCMLVWRFGELQGFTDDLFCTEAGKVDLHPSLDEILPSLPQREPYSGAYRPSK